MREVVRSIVSHIAPLDAEEADHRADVLDWIDGGSEIFRIAKPAEPPKHLVAYCVLVDTDARQILLVDHRAAQRWLPTGGHVDPGEHPSDAASRELCEELGIGPNFHAAVGNSPLLVTVTQTVGPSVEHTDVSLWFAFEGSVKDALTPDESEFTAARWWSFEDVAHGRGTRFDPHLPRFVRKLMDRSAHPEPANTGN